MRKKRKFVVFLKKLATIKTKFIGLFDKIFGKTKITLKEPEQAVIVRFLYGIERLEPLHQLEEDLERLIKQEGVGDYDGHEIATDYSDGYLYIYGPKADSLFNTIQPLLERTEFMKGAVARLRFGPPEDGVEEREVIINNKK